MAERFPAVLGRQAIPDYYYRPGARSSLRGPQDFAEVEFVQVMGSTAYALPGTLDFESAMLPSASGFFARPIQRQFPLIVSPGFCVDRWGCLTSVTQPMTIGVTSIVDCVHSTPFCNAEMLAAIAKITEALFPGPVEFAEGFDPAEPNARYMVFTAISKDPWKALRGRVIGWHNQVHDLCPEPINYFRLEVLPK
jgi:hypothetical protein